MPFFRNKPELSDFVDVQPKEPIPFFKYHLKPLDTLSFEQEETMICCCCKRETQVYYEYPFYSQFHPDNEIEPICPDCIKNGKASEKWGGTFQNPDFCDKIDNPSAVDELLHRTPGYYSQRQSYWLSHCNDFCALVDLIYDWGEIKKRNIEHEIMNDGVVLNDNINVKNFDALTRKINYNQSKYQGYLFKCLHCGAHRLYVDKE
jgi:uncharacterized protein CbrC (UPF0167 family)